MEDDVFIVVELKAWMNSWWLLLGGGEKVWIPCLEFHSHVYYWLSFIIRFVGSHWCNMVDTTFYDSWIEGIMKNMKNAKSKWIDKWGDECYSINYCWEDGFWVASHKRSQGLLNRCCQESGSFIFIWELLVQVSGSNTTMHKATLTDQAPTATNYQISYHCHQGSLVSSQGLTM